MRIRKQITELTNEDLAEHPIWELAIDEEGEEGQDEETVRPRGDLSVADPADGIFIVRTEFVAADGTRFDGFLFPHETRAVSFVQPTIVTDGGHVAFWFGMIPPRAGALEWSYERLGKTADELFPLRYRAVAGAEVDGELHGFMHYEPGSVERIVTLR